MNPGKYKTVVQEWDYCGGSSLTIVPVTVARQTGEMAQGAVHGRRNACTISLSGQGLQSLAPFWKTGFSVCARGKSLSPTTILRRVSRNHCPYCLSSRVYASRPKRWLEKMLFMFLLRLVRCHTCMRHHYRPIFLAVPENSRNQIVWRKQSQNASAERKKDRSA